MVPIFQVDAFTHKRFGGNPAAVVPLERWIEDFLLQAIAEENNLAETAFVVPHAEGYELRWFTPSTEVALCGHATLAAAHVLWNHLGVALDELIFHTRKSGILRVSNEHADGISMKFPSLSPRPCEASDVVAAALGQTPTRLFQGHYAADEFDYLARFDDEDSVAALSPSFASFASTQSRGIIATAPGKKCDFVSRYFAPLVGVDEDPVTGSAHCLLTPYWSRSLGKTSLTAMQISKRGGEIHCELDGDHVILRGHVVDYMVGEIQI